MMLRRRIGAGGASGPTLMGVVAAMALLMLVMLRMLVMFTPELDPLADLSSEFVSTEFGSLGLAVTDLMMVFVMLLAVADAMLRGRRPMGWLLVLWSIGFVLAMLHARQDPDSLRLCGNWTAAMSAGVAAAHLAGEPAVRRLMLAGLIALIIPLTGQAVYQVAVEQPETIVEYRRKVAAGEELPAAAVADPRKFEQRLMQYEATGRTGFSNVFGTVMMSLTLAAAGAAVALRRQGALVWGVAGMGFVALVLTFSKGANLALIVAGGAAVVCAWMLPRRWWPMAAMGVVMLGIAAVVIRGAVFGEYASPTGERSLLFRWQYWMATVRMIAESPLFGVGPGMFGERYLVVKNPLSPEDVSDPHNVLLALGATLGVGGWAWGCAVVAMLWRAAGARPFGASLNGGSGSVIDARQGWMIVGVIGAVVFAVQHLVEAPRYVWEAEAMWFAGAAAWVTLTWWLMQRAELDSAAARLGVLAAAMGLVLHAQIEMSLTNAMASPVLMTVLGIACSGNAEGEPSARVSKRVLWLLGGAVVVMFVTCTLATAGRQQHIARAVAHIQQRNAMRAVMEDLPTARAYMLGSDTPIAGATARLLLGMAAEAHKLRDLTGRDELIKQAAAQSLSASPGQQHHLAATVMHQAYAMTGDRRYLLAAVREYNQWLPSQPYAIRAHLTAADAAHEAGDWHTAATVYQRVLELDKQAFLDPNIQLTDAERRRVEGQLQSCYDRSR
jgi:O-antigen ligase